MVNNTIPNPTNKADDFCNINYITFNDIAKDLGVTYAALYAKHTNIIKWALGICLAFTAVVFS